MTNKPAVRRTTGPLSDCHDDCLLAFADTRGQTSLGVQRRSPTFLAIRQPHVFAISESKCTRLGSDCEGVSRSGVGGVEVDGELVAPLLDVKATKKLLVLGLAKLFPTVPSLKKIPDHRAGHDSYPLKPVAHRRLQEVGEPIHFANLCGSRFRLQCGRLASSACGRLAKVLRPGLEQIGRGVQLLARLGKNDPAGRELSQHRCRLFQLINQICPSLCAQLNHRPGSISDYARRVCRSGKGAPSIETKKALSNAA